MSRLAFARPVALGMVEAGLQTGYAIAQAVSRSTSGFWPAGQNAIYPELGRLVDAGLLSTTPDGVGRRRRDLHTLTDAGRAVLHDWRTSNDHLRIEQRDEGLLKLHLGDSLTVAEARDVLEAACAHRRDRLAQLDRSRPEPGAARPGAYVSWATGHAALHQALDWYEQLVTALAHEPLDEPAMPLLVDWLVHRSMEPAS